MIEKGWRPAHRRLAAYKKMSTSLPQARIKLAKIVQKAWKIVDEGMQKAGSMLAKD